MPPSTRARAALGPALGSRQDGGRWTSSSRAQTGAHPDLGRVTLRELLATRVAHDLDHLAQIARTMARQYAGAVGPWRAYLPGLDG